MKKLVFIVVIFLAKGVSGQTSPITDTLAYLKQIEAQKSTFIGQPFSVLKDSLKIGIQFFGPIQALHYAKDKETSTRFYFINPQKMEDFSYRYIEVYWQTPLNADVSSQIFDDATTGWNGQALSFYSSGIIANLKAAAAPVKMYDQPCEGFNKMKINGICYTGQRVNIASGYSPSLGKWTCEYRYKFGPDCVSGPIYTDTLSAPAAPLPNCTPL